MGNGFQPENRRFRGTMTAREQTNSDIPNFSESLENRQTRFYVSFTRDSDARKFQVFYMERSWASRRFVVFGSLSTFKAFGRAARTIRQDESIKTFLT